MRLVFQLPANITSVVDAPRLVSSDASPTRPECAVTRLSMPAVCAAAVNRNPTPGRARPVPCRRRWPSPWLSWTVSGNRACGDIATRFERAHSRFPGHALTPTGVMAIRCKQFHLPDL